MTDVARKAGVAPMTVSRALRGDGYVVEEKKERIINAAKELGYVLNMSAGSLSSNKTNFVSVLIPSINNSNFSETVHGIAEVLHSKGMQILFGYTDYSMENEEHIISTMLKRRPEGIILTGGVHTDQARNLLKNAHIPVVEIWDLPEKPINHAVGFLNSRTIEDMMARLLFLGYRNIAFLGGDEGGDNRGRERRLGYERAVKTLGLDKSCVIPLGPPPITMMHGKEGIIRLIKEWPEVDAVVCVSDLPAFGAIMECQRQGWKVPERLAVAGFGDFEVSSFSCPSITTINVGCAELGRNAGEIMAKAIEGIRCKTPISPQIITTPHTVIEREST
ncbi:LacI family DNA-binding transcriptional regulator [Cohaesibacter celericrescens]|uniref:LacI family transcriptional regulator n=1 Tax=Cohaesibacter celericrescens TaxID=2067669 RepID=A0A2N5XRH5_9HYPH|nr:LacI family DNA-binding transcriptional regulator [Cohaesibacter celericrescens]PLW77060.1 LacI family transcriptional regulator [Cohaesibacter celericrescens]